ncbi:Uncharacterized N-acetyltransferase p20 [Geodia barretti]|uniref:Uncharacterized N-acetyltransferase p20 n=1 Tax=Geodia barretti TaxID=519541 RepID=A0AA35WZ06_GEOBA|nr:Uncharacterized N-acetyltransferase p20 [Geodia barretti]
MFLDQQREQPRRRFQLVIARRQDDRLIGNCGIRRKPDNDWEADIGYELAHDCWGLGYATEAAGAMVDFGFLELGLHRISSWCIAENTASARVLERLGFRLEGRLRQNQYFKDQWLFTSSCLFDDAARANKFYADVFGWESSKFESGPEDYYLQQTGGDDEPYGIGGALIERAAAVNRGGTLVILGVDNLDALHRQSNRRRG